MGPAKKDLIKGPTTTKAADKSSVNLKHETTSISNAKRPSASKISIDEALK